jgi:hypothetical protein
LSGKFLEIIFAERAFILAVLAGEQKIMVFPKLILVRGALGCLSGPLGFITQKSILEITEAYLAGFYVCFIDLTTRVSCKFAAVGSLKIAEFDNRHRSVGVAFEMACRSDEHGHHFLVG